METKQYIIEEPMVRSSQKGIFLNIHNKQKWKHTETYKVQKSST